MKHKKSHHPGATKVRVIVPLPQSFYHSPLQCHISASNQPSPPVAPVGTPDSDGDADGD